MNGLRGTWIMEVELLHSLVKQLVLENTYALPGSFRASDRFGLKDSPSYLLFALHLRSPRLLFSTQAFQICEPGINSQPEADFSLI